MESLENFAHYRFDYSSAPFADPPMWFVLLLTIFLLIIFSIIFAGSVVLAASIYRNFLRPDIKKAPLNSFWTVIVLGLLAVLIIPTVVLPSPYVGFVMVKSVLIVLLAISAWAYIWQKTEPKHKISAKRTSSATKNRSAAKAKSTKK